MKCFPALNLSEVVQITPGLGSCTVCSFTLLQTPVQSTEGTDQHSHVCVPTVRNITSQSDLTVQSKLIETFPDTRITAYFHRRK